MTRLCEDCNCQPEYLKDKHNDASVPSCPTCSFSQHAEWLITFNTN